MQTMQEVVTNNGNSNGTIKDHTLANGDNHLINLDKGDPTMFYPYWKKLDNECSVTIRASELISYTVNPNEADAFFEMPEFIEAVRRMHRLVGNAVTEGRYIIGGTGSSQLFIFALRALASTIKESTTSNTKHIPVVCAEPYYSFYKEAIEAEKSELYQWQGDANTFEANSNPYIEVVTSPNNPDGQSRKEVVKGKGVVVHDLAYYWPHHTPITSPAAYDVMLFTLSKATGHAGSRVGWAIVKDKEIAKKMKNQVRLITIGSCQEGQLRATKILNFVADRYEHEKPPIEGLFEYGHRVLARRWQKLRAVVGHTGVFSLSDFPSSFCTFMGKLTNPNPAFAWLEFESEEEAETLTKGLKILARSGSRFGVSVSGRFIRVSMMGDEHDFNIFIERLSSLITKKIC